MERRLQLRTGAFAVMAEQSSELALQIKDPPKTLKADIWSCFGLYQQSGRHDLDMSYAVCKTCRSKIKYVGNTTNLRNHVSRFHPELLTTTPAVEPLSPAQPRIDVALSIIPPNSEKGKKITQAVGAFIAKDLRPYSVVENPGFKHMLKTLEPRYKVPARSHFAEQVIPALYDETKAKILTSMSKANLVAITCDSWTSVATESYITVTAHYMSEDWQIISHVLQTRAVYESHTGAHLAELLSDVVSEWQLSDKDIVLVTDNASNMILAAQIRKLKHVRCFAHTLTLSSQRGLRVASLTRLLISVVMVSRNIWKSVRRHLKISPEDGPHTPLKANLGNADPELCIRLLKDPTVVNYSELQRRLETCDESWMVLFLELKGLDLLLERLLSCGSNYVYDDWLQNTCMACIRAVMKSSAVLQFILDNKSYVKTLIQALDTAYVKVKIEVTALLERLALFNPQAYQLTLDGFEYKTKKKQQYRFSVIVNELHGTDDVRYQVVLMYLINALILGQDKLWRRVRLRREFIDPIVISDNEWPDIPLNELSTTPPPPPPPTATPFLPPPPASPKPLPPSSTFLPLSLTL
uniref:BED-type domain-containing protein n=1 Tax=Nothobranchius korthausae TaxID=1143690 RepID=A0A1A8H4B8_9TELE